MKKTLIYFVAALAFAGCSKNEVTNNAPSPVNSDVIGFNSSTNGTRANNNAVDPQLKAGFEVIGLDKSDNSIFTQPDATHESTYKWLTDKWSWKTTSDDKKWPTTDVYPLSFIVAYPAPVTTAFGPWATDGAKYTQAISIDTDLTANEDMLAAFASVDNKPASGIAKLVFKHILSNIQFQIVSPQGYTIYIQSLTIKSVAKEGRTFNYKQAFAADSYSTEPTPSYTSLADYVHMTGDATNKVAVITGAGYDTPATQGQTLYSGNGKNTNTATWKLMPQKNVTVWDKTAFSEKAKEFTSGTWADFIAANATILDGSMIELVYRMTDKDGKSIVGWTKNEQDPGTSKPATDMYVKVAFPLDIASLNTNKGWEPAKKYTYQIKLGTPDASNGTLIDPEYKDENGSDTTDKVDNPKTNPGEDITKTDGYIGFEVSIDDWTDGGKNEIK